MVKAKEPDFWEVDRAQNLLGIGEFKKTNMGTFVSLLNIQWRTTNPNWIESFRIIPISSTHFSMQSNTGESGLLSKCRTIWKSNIELNKKLDAPLPVEELDKFKDIYWAWEYIRSELHKKYHKNFQELGINKTTTLDYLNLQSLGIKDYQKILANLEGAKPLTIRDRIAYARRYEWIPSVGHGERKSEMTRIKK
jgi:hypothetical protein